MRDLYETRTVRGLAQRSGNAEESLHAESPVTHATKSGRPRLATTIQLAGIAFAAVLGSLVSYGILVEFGPSIVTTLGLLESLILLPVLFGLFFLVYCPVSIVAAVAAKRLLIGRYRAGRYPAWGSFYVRNWFVQRFVAMIPWGTLAGTELTNVVLRALGARIGRKVHIARGVEFISGGWDLLEMKSRIHRSGCSAPDDRPISRSGNCRLRDHRRGATLDTRSGMGPGSKLAPRAYLSPLSMSRRELVPSQFVSRGVPAKMNGTAQLFRRPIEMNCSGPQPSALMTVIARMALVTFGLLPIALLLTLWSPLRVRCTGIHLALAPDSIKVGSCSLICSIPLLITLELVFNALMCRALGTIKAGTYGQYGPTTIQVVEGKLLNGRVNGSVDRFSGHLAASRRHANWPNVKSAPSAMPFLS